MQSITLELDEVTSQVTVKEENCSSDFLISALVMMPFYIISRACETREDAHYMLNSMLRNISIKIDKLYCDGEE